MFPWCYIVNFQDHARGILLWFVNVGVLFFLVNDTHVDGIADLCTDLAA